MRIAWFTPFSTRSAIGRFSRDVVDKLRDRADVELFHFDSEDTHSASVPTRRFKNSAAVSNETLSSFDAIAYNLGNHVPFHRDIYEVSLRHPGINILHDFVMHHFMAGYLLGQSRDSALYISLMTELYGEPGRTAAEESLNGSGTKVWESERVSEFPMWEIAVQHAMGVVVHADYFRSHVAASFGGPVTKIPLAYTVDCQGAVKSRTQLGIADDTVMLLTVGHVNANKQVESAIEAVAAVRGSCEQLVYYIVGPCPREYRSHLEDLVAKRGIRNVVQLTGEVNDVLLRSYLAAADVCINLRFPPTEGASASAIEEMLCGKPIVVNDIGFYHELPDDCVVKVPPRNQSELNRQLQRLAADPELRGSLGERSRTFAESEFAPQRYANEFLAFATDVARARPLLSLCDEVGATCARIGISRDSYVSASLAQQIHSLFCGNGPTNGNR